MDPGAGLVGNHCFKDLSKFYFKIKLSCDSPLTLDFGDYVQEIQATYFSLYVGNCVTDLRGAGGTGRRGTDGTLLDEVESWRDWGKAEVLDTVAGVSTLDFSVLADR